LRPRENYSKHICAALDCDGSGAARSSPTLYKHSIGEEKAGSQWQRQRVEPEGQSAEEQITAGDPLVKTQMKGEKV